MTNQKHTKENENIDLRAIFNEFLRNWYLFAFCVIVALGFAVVFNKFSPPVYKVSSSLLFSGSSSSRGVNRTEFIEGLELTTENKEVQNEILILQSQPLVESVVKTLGFDVSYYSKADYLPYRFIGFRRLGRFFLREIYKSSPYEVVLDPDHLQPVNLKFNIDILSNEEFSLNVKTEDIEVYDYTKDLIIL